MWAWGWHFCSLLYLGFVIGALACGMGLYFLFLKIRGVHKLGDVPGIGEFGTLQAGSTLVMIGTYCFYYSLITYLPLQNGACCSRESTSSWSIPVATCARNTTT